MSARDPLPLLLGGPPPSQPGRELPLALHSSRRQRPREMAAVPYLPLPLFGVPRPPAPFLTPRLTRFGPFRARLPSPGSRAQATVAAALGGRLRPAGGRGAAGRGRGPSRDNAAAAGLGGARAVIYSSPGPRPERGGLDTGRADAGGRGRWGGGERLMCWGREPFERRKWRLVQVPPLPTPSSPHFAASHAPSDQPVYPRSRSC